jgi:hypothetical protein
MFENFTKFFAVKKNITIFVAALVIVVGILVLKNAGLYEGMKDETKPETASETASPQKTPSSIKAKPMGSN